MSLNIKNMSLMKLTVCFFLFFLLLNGIYYTLIGLNIQFLRAESGLYLQATAYAPEEIEEFISEKLFSSVNGHYTPLFFLAEYWQSVVFSTNENFWFWRQMFVGGIFLTSIAIFLLSLCMIGKDATRPTLKMIAIALTITIIFGFQPIITTMIAWPFMAFQLICLTFSIIAFYYLIQFAQNQNRAYLWMALGFGYLTMHAVGTGLAISLSVLFTATLLIALRWYSSGSLKPSQFLKSLIPVFCVATLTLIHAYLMVKDVADNLDSEKVSLATSGVRFGGILIEMLHTSLNYIWAPGGLVFPSLRGLRADSVYGWGLVLIIITIIISQIYRFLKQPSGESLVRITLLTLPSLTLFLIVGMIIYRVQTIEDNDVLIGYIIGDRYLIFSSFFGFLFCMGMYLKSKIDFSKTVVALFAIAAIVCLTGNTTFMATVAPEIWPNKSISHSEYWNDILDSVQSDPDPNSPNWNLSTQPVTIEFACPRGQFRAVIEKQLSAKKN